MATVSVVEFVKPVPPYHVGEKAGFPHDIAETYARAGAGRIVREHVPAVDPKTIEDQKRALAAEKAAGIDSIIAEALAARAPSARNRAA